MKGIIILFIVLFLLCPNVYGQWVHQYSGMDENLTGVSFFDESTGAIVGLNGIILWTTNSGNEWVQQQSGTNNVLWDIEMLSSTSAIAVGDSRTIVKTTNSGKNWFPINAPSGSSLVDVEFYNENTGFIVTEMSGIILKTINGGITWVQVSHPNPSHTLYGVTFGDSLNVYVAGEGDSHPCSLLKSTNCGATWIRICNMTVSSLYKISFINAQTGVLTNWGYYPLKTTNGGYNWYAMPTQDFYYHVSFVDSNTLYFAGTQGKICKSTNGGVSFELQNTGTSVNLQSINFVNSNTGFAVGNNGTILHTLNGGVVGVSPINTSTPPFYKLKQNYPNPFNPSTKINFAIPKNGFVNLKVFDITGKEIVTLVSETLQAGNYQYQFTTDEYLLPSGVYFYRLESDEFKEVRRMILIR